MVLTTVGHGAWESALTNTLDPGDAVLIPDCGLFGKRWAMMARDLGYEVVSTSEHLRSPTDPAEITDLSGRPEHEALLEELTQLLAGQLYGGDEEWVRDGKLVGLPNREFRPGPNRGLSSQRGHHWPPPPKTDMQQIQWHSEDES